MKQELPKEKAELFNLITRDLRTTLKNSVLYVPGHPVFDFSIKNFKTSLNKWFPVYKDFNIGFSYDSILLDGAYVEEKNTIYKEVAGYMHARGIVSLSVSSGITDDELVKFFSLMKDDIKVIREKGGVAKTLPSMPHLKIKDIDYGALLASAGPGEVEGEEDIWQSLSKIADQAKDGKLPESKFEFLVDFLKDSNKSASVLNKIYKDAVTSLKDDAAVNNIRDTITKIYTYFEKNSGKDIKETAKNVADIITNLDPNLVIKLFEEAKKDSEGPDMAKEITKNLSDDFMANFMTTLVSSDGSANENLLKIFDRLMPDKSRSGNVASMFTDKMLAKKDLNEETLAQLQVSIKEIFRANPTSNFMSQMYKMTVDTFVSMKAGVSDIARKVSPLLREYRKSVDIEGLKKEEASLLINILWLEDNALEFKKFGSKLVSLIPEIINLKGARVLKNILLLLTEKLRPEQQRNKDIDQEAKGIIKKVAGAEALVKIVSMLPDVDGDEVEDIIYILSKTKETSVGILMDTYILEKDRTRREKLSYGLSGMKEEASGEIMRRIGYCDAVVAKDLFKIMKKIDPEKAHTLTKDLLQHKEPKMRAEAMEAFEFETDEERGIVFSLIKHDKDDAVREKAMVVLLKTEDDKVIGDLFKCARKEMLKGRLILKLVELCGQLKSQKAFRHLQKIFLKLPLFGSKKIDDLRIASAVSLRQLGTDEAMELIKKGTNDRRSAVKRMCGIILELEEEKKPEEGESKDGL